jgi:lipopolysaccharide/colanic/teichoic acid biosynthesis glycosyltransferase
MVVNDVPPAVDGPSKRLRAWGARAWMLARIEGARALAPAARRAFDVGFGVVALALASPVIAAACVAVKATSRGPAILRQTRVGKGGRPFTLFKLRTMYEGAEAQRDALERRNDSRGGVTFKMRNDPRVTRVGRWLRKLSIDELPQLWNVATGSMTVFGPRPPLPAEVARYDARARRRLEMKPGLTCYWQVQGRSDLSFEEQVALDLQFIDTAALRDEVFVLARTVPAVLMGKGAY